MTDAASARKPSSPNASRSAGKPRFQAARELAHVLARLTPFLLGLATIWFVISLALWGSAGRAGREALTVVVDLSSSGGNSIARFERGERSMIHERVADPVASKWAVTAKNGAFATTAERSSQALHNGLPAAMPGPRPGSRPYARRSRGRAPSRSSHSNQRNYDSRRAGRWRHARRCLRRSPASSRPRHDQEAAGFRRRFPRVASIAASRLRPDSRNSPG